MPGFDYDPDYGDASYNLKKALEERKKEEDARIRSMITEKPVEKPVVELPKPKIPNETVQNNLLQDCCHLLVKKNMYLEMSKVFFHLLLHLKWLCSWMHCLQ